MKRKLQGSLLVWIASLATPLGLAAQPANPQIDPRHVIEPFVVLTDGDALLLPAIAPPRDRRAAVIEAIQARTREPVDSGQNDADGVEIRRSRGQNHVRSSSPPGPDGSARSEASGWPPSRGWRDRYGRAQSSGERPR